MSRELACAWIDGSGDAVCRLGRTSATRSRTRLGRCGAWHAREIAESPQFERALDVYEAQRAADGRRITCAVASAQVDELTPLVRAELQRAAHSRITLLGVSTVGRPGRFRAGSDGVVHVLLAYLLLPVGVCPPLRRLSTISRRRAAGATRSIYEAWCRAISLLRVPVAVVPCGTSDEGLPIGVQIVGRRFHDDECWRWPRYWKQRSERGAPIRGMCLRDRPGWGS